jgi:hypothetical protein
MRNFGTDKMMNQREIQEIMAKLQNEQNKPKSGSSSSSSSSYAGEMGVFLTGGSVKHYLSAHPTPPAAEDFDIITSASPAEIKKVFSEVNSVPDKPGTFEVETKGGQKGRVTQCEAYDPTPTGLAVLADKPLRTVYR